MRPLSTVASVVVGLAVLACGDDGGGAGAWTLDNFPERQASVVCEYGVQCGLYPDEDTCLATQQIVPLAQFLSDLEAGLLDTPSADLLEACADAPATCDRALNLTSHTKSTLQACVDAVRGNQRDGATCNASSQCSGGACARPETCTDQCCEGTCATGALPIGAEGQDCGIGCDIGLYCALESDGMSLFFVCRSQVAASGQCLQIDACGDGYFCDFPDTETPGTCQPVAGPGEACNGASASKDFGCRDITTYCDTTSNTCVPRPALGEPCSDAAPCMPYGRCDGGSCVLRPVAGESCDEEARIFCLGDLECISGSCAFETASTDVCTL